MRTYTSHKPRTGHRFGVEKTRERGIYAVYTVPAGAGIAQRIGAVQRVTPWRWRAVGMAGEWRTMLEAQTALMEAK